MRLTIGLMLLSTLILTGCMAQRYVVDVDGLAAAERIASLDGERFILIPGNEGVSAGDLQFREYAGYVKKALEARGFIEASTFDDARIAIFVTYGISDPQQNIASYLTPTWGQTGIASARTIGSVTSHGNSSVSYNATTTFTPSYGVTGYANTSYTYETFTRGLSLSAYDLTAYILSGKEIELWRTMAISTGRSGDLRRVMPMLVAAIEPFIATNTGGSMRMALGENEAAVVRIRGANVSR